ncbi:MAG: NAD(P)-dependent oxidoreductase [Lachnospiraceae bacterium]|jgi:lactate dehydrogenase-like 2-hydroxyacid dehydrogenase
MKIAVLEKASLGRNVDLSGLDALGETVYYDTTLPEQIAERAADADVLVINKLKMNAQMLGNPEKLGLITVTATGVDNFDLEFCRERKICVSNMRGYSTRSVAQQTFALALTILNRMEYFTSFVRSGSYIGDTSGDYYQVPIHEIAGKTWGIVGLGRIGTMVADIASAFGARAVYCSLSGEDRSSVYQRLSFDELLAESDIVSVHSPLNEKSQGLFGREAFHKMKSTAVFLNLGRGPIVREKDLAEAILDGEIAAAGLDVLDGEPLRADSPLVPLLKDPRLVITPHVGWASEESRQRAVDEVVKNIQAYIEGHPRNTCW